MALPSSGYLTTFNSMGIAVVSAGLRDDRGRRGGLASRRGRVRFGVFRQHKLQPASDRANRAAQTSPIERTMRRFTMGNLLRGPTGDHFFTYPTEQPTGRVSGTGIGLPAREASRASSRYYCVTFAAAWLSSTPPM